jgi:hypothetical protein
MLPIKATTKTTQKNSLNYADFMSNLLLACPYSSIGPSAVVRIGQRDKVGLTRWLIVPVVKWALHRASVVHSFGDV